MKTWVYTSTVRGQKVWTVEFSDQGRRRRRFFTTERKARVCAGKLSTSASAKEAWEAQNEAERRLAIAQWHHARGRSPSTQSSPEMETAITELLAAKQQAGLSPRYLRVLGIVLRQFARGLEALPLRAVTLKDVESFLSTKSPAYRSTVKARLSSLFRFAVRRGYCADNPCARCEPIKAVRPSPVVFTVEQVARCLALLRGNRALAWFVLSTFAGLRPEEAAQTQWGDIDFDEKWIRVEAQTSKVRQRRVVYPRAEVWPWLRLARKAELPLKPQPRRRALRRLRKVLGWAAWPKDITRHTAASYWLAMEGGAERIADQLGHSEGVLRRNYKALVTRAEAKRFWGIRPSWLKRSRHIR